MICEHALALFKNKLALVKETTADRIVIALPDGGKIKVREKDIDIIHPGPVHGFSGIERPLTAEPGAFAPDGAIREVWELLAGQGPISLREVADLAFGEYSPASAWAACRLLLDGLYFTGTVAAIQCRPPDQVEADEKKREEKRRAAEERELFLKRLKSRRPDLPDDRRFIQDVEALACGKSEKSRTMKEIGLGETPEDAHALLVESGFWAADANPHPARCGVSMSQPKNIPEPAPQEDRRSLGGLAAFAIDNPWSHDPDDAVSLEIRDGRQILYVHVADPASSIGSGSPCEREARDRGATLYVPEGAIRMLAEESLPLFALGLAESSPALTFKMTMDSNGEIAETEIFPSTVNVTRLTYGAADKLMAEADGKALRDLYALAERNMERRAAAGAVSIDIPEIYIGLKDGQVVIEPLEQFRSADMVRECMLLAGEGAAMWAIQRNLPFPYIAQEAGDMPGEILPGIAGAYQLRRCMRPRILSVKPGRHWGLGMDAYTQVTSPLRRYTDLLAHIQIRASLRGGAPLSADEVMARIGAGEAAAAATTHAERASRSHWKMVYLSGKKDSVWDAVAMEKKGSRWAAVIPDLALETLVPLRKDPAPNDSLRLILKSASIPRLEANFTAEE
ncbi:MAG: ribonuclease catalytic domain-containing protein [Treponema sp.]|nr:ribonuclease catalytic domain-containing protein [Treponema sp.]